MQNMTKKRIYISGPMSGIYNFNRHSFEAAADAIKRRGYKPVNPAELDFGEDLSHNGDWRVQENVWRRIINEDLDIVRQCDALVKIHGWENSTGARMEIDIAKQNGIPVFTLEEFLAKADSGANLSIESLSMPSADPEAISAPTSGDDCRCDKCDARQNKTPSSPISEAQKRKQIPMFSGLLAYFPDALASVAHCSWVGNEQHNKGEPLHWAREKSTDQEDCLIRHLMQKGTIDSDGVRHSAKMAWRALAILQLEMERAGEKIL